MAEDFSMMIGDNQLSLADIAGLDMSNVEAVRYQRTPAGCYIFSIAEAKLGTYGEGDNAKAAAMFELKIENVISLSDDSIDQAAWVGKVHKETFFLRKEHFMDDLGRVVAFLQDIGLQTAGDLQVLLDASKGHLFQGFVTHTPDKNDKDKIYANLNRDQKKLQAYSQEAA